MPSIHDALSPLAVAFRRRRLAHLCRLLDLAPTTRVLDVGGVAGHWDLAPVRPRVTILNLVADVGTTLLGDGCALPFGDDAFDLVYANSVIEHLGTPARQRAFAAECRRVGVAVCVQTPDRAFPLEPHYLAPFVHWLPRTLQRRVVRYGTIWGLVNRPGPASVADMVDQLRLLSAREMAALFPDCRLRRERLLGLPKSVTAVRV